MNEGACLIFQHEESLERAGSQCNNMKSSTYQNTLFVVVISLLIISIESTSHLPTRHKELRRVLNQTFPDHSTNFLTMDDVGNISKEKNGVQFDDVRTNPHDKYRFKRHKSQSTKESILRWLGIHKSGKPRHKIRVPQLMLDLYKQQVTKNTWVAQGRRMRKDGAYFEADVVRSIEVAGEVSFVGATNTRVSLRTVVDGQHFHDKTIREAELKVFYTPPTIKSSSSSSSSSSSPPLDSNTQHKLQIYRLTKCKPDCRRKLIDTNLVDDQRARWVTFNVTEALRSLKTNSKLHLALEVTDVIIDKVFENDDLATDKEDDDSWQKKRKLVQETFSIVTDDDDDTNHRRPFLVIYADYTHQQQRSPPPHRPRRSLSESKRRKGGNVPNRQKPINQFQKQCSRKQLYVDFAELDWLEWIVAPSGFHAFLCQGNCQRDIHHINATNHAVLQNLLHFKNSALVPPTCCVPTQLSPIALLIIDFDTVVLKNYKDMIVDACGCR